MAPAGPPGVNNIAALTVAGAQIANAIPIPNALVGVGSFIVLFCPLVRTLSRLCEGTLKGEEKLSKKIPGKRVTLLASLTCVSGPKQTAGPL